MEPLTHLEIARGVATITLDSPHNRNALSAQLLVELTGHLAAAAADTSVRVVVLTATGTVFCSGADLSTPGSVTTAPVTLVDLLTQLWELDTPVLCVLNGAVRAGGIGIVAAADLVLAPQGATFAFSEVRLGLVPAIIAVLCQRRMSPRMAARLLLTGEVFDADVAAAAGLVTEVHPAEQLEARTTEVVDQLVLGEPGAVAATKALLRDLPALDLAGGFTLAEEISAERFASPEAAEGIAAFRQKRPPSWVPQR